MKITVENVSQSYENHQVLKDISFTASSGEVTALLGPNGSGKSTLIKTIADILPLKKGKILMDNRDIKEIEKNERTRLLGYVPQSFHYTSFTSVLDTVLIGRRPYMSWKVSDEDLEAVDIAMNAMNVADLSERYINELSGGQRQRVFIARTIAQNPSFYLFDEPTSSLDLRHQFETLERMQKLVHENNSGMLIALHDLNLAVKFADYVILLKDGKIYGNGKPEDVLTSEAVRDVYGVESEIVKNEKGRFVLSYEPTK